MSIFARIVECGSISAAAEVLQLSKSVVSQHLSMLERELGVVLLLRTTRRQTLTEAGGRFYEQCQLLNSVAEQAWAEAQETQQAPQGTVRITAPHALMDALIAPQVGALLGQYSRLKIELLAEDEALDLMRSRVDLAVRVGHSANSALKQRRIGGFRDVLCGTARWAEQSIDNNTPYIAQHWQGHEIQHRIQRAGQPPQSLSFLPVCRANSHRSCLALIESGAGIGLVPEFVFHLRPTLFALTPVDQADENPVYLLHPYEQLPLAVKVVMQAVESALSPMLNPS